jgi:hypothetical protein
MLKKIVIIILTKEKRIKIAVGKFLSNKKQFQGTVKEKKTSELNEKQRKK